MKNIAGFWDLQKTCGLTEKQRHLESILEKLSPIGTQAFLNLWKGQSTQGACVLGSVTVSSNAPGVNREEGGNVSWDSKTRFYVAYDGYLINRKELIQEHRLPMNLHDEDIIKHLFTVMDPIKACRTLNGGFAFVVWDDQEHLLYMVRDRIGVRPLFWGWGESGSLLFGSSLKRFFYDSDFKPQLSQEGVSCFLQMGYLPDAICILKNAYKVIPGHLVRMNRHGKVDQEILVPWEEFYQDTKEQIISKEEAVHAFKNVMQKSVQSCIGQASSVGVFLSSGVDSTLISALAQEHFQKTRSRPISTFSIGFQEEKFNEAHRSQMIAQHLGTQHHELYLTPEKAREVLDKIPIWWDEPFSDSSQMAVSVLHSWVKEHGVDVALGGEGDAFISGSKQLNSLIKAWRYMAWCPLFLRRFLGNTMQAFGVSYQSKWADVFSELIKSKNFAELFQKTYNIYGGEVRQKFSPRWVPENPFEDFLERCSERKIAACINQFMLESWDTVPKVSFASRGCHLDLRLPFLDPHVFNKLLSFPEECHFQGGRNKWVARQVLGQYLPERLFNFPKKGFPIPVAEWLRTAFREEAEKTFSVDWMADLNIDPRRVQKMWDIHLKKKGHYARRLWNVFILLRWCDTWNIRSL